MGWFGRKKEEVSSAGIEYLIVGLGNPGKQYEATRHNAGYLALDQIAESCSVKLDRVRFHSLTAQTTIAGKKCLLMKPLTYMNLSGEAVLEAMNYYKLPVERLLVFFDDISLDPGKLRIRRKGSHGGHNGIKNILSLTEQDCFPRVKIGVGKKPHPDYDLADWVLSRFTKEEEKQLKAVWEHCPNIAELILSGEMDRAMNLYNA